MADAKNPLTADDWRTLDKAQRLMADALPEMDKAEACGVDCTHFRAMKEQLDQIVAAMRAHYGDSHPERAKPQ